MSAPHVPPQHRAGPGRRGWIAAGTAIAVLVVAVAVVLATRNGSPPSPTAVDASLAAPAAPVPPEGSASPAAQSPATSAGRSATPPPRASTAKPNPAPSRFGTVAAGGTLPTGAQCASWVRAKPLAENKGANAGPNHTTGHRIPGDFFSGDDPRAGQRLAPRVDGQFTGTTAEILRWVACKWGLDEDVVRAQAAIESWWLQSTRGDWGSDPAGCAPGHGLGADGRPGQCPQSYGLLQDRYPYMKGGWPGFATSTAMNSDVAYAVWRACFEGYEGWLNTVERGTQYAAGDAWGCVGRWFSGRWHTQPSEDYVVRVKDYLSRRIWETRDFQQP